MNSTYKTLLLGIIAVAIPISSARAAETTSTTNLRWYDYAAGYGGTAAWLTVEFGLKSTLAPESPRWSEPPSFDRTIRDALVWGGKYGATQGGFASDVLLYAGYIPSVLWAPALSDAPYHAYVVTMLQVLAANGLLTNAVKFSVGRERPSFHFDPDSDFARDHPSEGALSFYSGHASLTFAVGAAHAVILGREHPSWKRWLWPAFLAPAVATAYFRVAGDKHYASDVAVGALAGTGVGAAVALIQYDRLLATGGDAAEPRLSIRPGPRNGLEIVYAIR